MIPDRIGSPPVGARSADTSDPGAYTLPAPATAAARPRRTNQPVAQQGTQQGKQRGVTLIELMVGLTVLVILATIGIPTMNELVTSSRIATLTNDLTLSLTLARAEAVRRGALVRVCPTTDGEHCGGNWQDGWLVMAMDGGEVIGVWPTHYPTLGPFPLKLGFNAAGPITARALNPTPPTISFNGLGTTEGEGVRFLVGEIGRHGARLIDLAAAGRLAVKPL